MFVLDLFKITYVHTESYLTLKNAFTKQKDNYAKMYIVNLIIIIMVIAFLSKTQLHSLVRPNYYHI